MKSKDNRSAGPCIYGSARDSGLKKAIMQYQRMAGCDRQMGENDEGQ